MNALLEHNNASLVATPVKIKELVRGTDLEMIAQVEPLVYSSDVTLDCRAIERIDAAGIAALISLYGRAREAGHTFHICNVKAHVAEILGLVGLDRVLITEDAGCKAHSPCASLARAAA